MPKYKHTKTGRVVNATGKLAAHYDRLKSYEKVGDAPIDKFETQQAYVDSGQAAEDAKKRRRGQSTGATSS